MTWRKWTILQDVPYAIRVLRRTPGFTAAALLTLALGIGANTAIFSVVNAVIFRPLSYPRADQLIHLTTRYPSLGIGQFPVSPPEYLEFQAINRSFATVGAFRTTEANLLAGDRPLRVRAALVDEHLLSALALRPARGRLFRAGETDAGAPPEPALPAPTPAVAILSHELWQTAFGGQEMVGRRIEIDGVRREVIGILPPGADVMDRRTEIWLPLGLSTFDRQNRGSHFLELIGRLEDDVPPQAAQVELMSLIGNWSERTGAANHVFTPSDHVLQMKPLRDEILGGAGQGIWVLQAAVVVVLLIACANLANLMLVRAETRRREFALRAALGAGRARLLQQFITEGLLLSLTGGAIGLLLARVGLRALIRVYPTSLPRINEVIIDIPVWLFTFLVASASGILFALAPVMYTRVKHLATTLNDGGRAGTAVGQQVRRGLATIEVALAVVLVIGATLLLRTVYNLTNVDAGFNRSQLATFSLTLPPATYPTAVARVDTYERILRGLRAVPGVQAATAMAGLPPNRPLNATFTDIPNHPNPPGVPAETVDYFQFVMSDYFATLGIPIVRGRTFQSTDAASDARFAIVNETFVNTFWKGQNPIGQHFRLCCNERIPWTTVVGVAGDVKQGGVDRTAGSEAYVYLEQSGRLRGPAAFAPETMHFVLRTTSTAAALSNAIADVVRGTDPTVPVVRLRDMDGVYVEAIRRPRLLAQLLGGFAALALVLAAIGTYGVLSFIVTDRRREIGIRLALGAERGNVLLHVMKQGFALITIGLAAGLAGAFAVNRLIASLLFGVEPTDGPTFAAVGVAIAMVAAAACWLPAWRASRLDPATVLHET